MKITHNVTTTALDVLTAPPDPTRNCVPQNLAKQFRRRAGTDGASNSTDTSTSSTSTSSTSTIPSAVGALWLIAYGPAVCVVQSNVGGNVVTHRLTPAEFETEWTVIQ